MTVKLPRDVAKRCLELAGESRPATGRRAAPLSPVLIHLASGSEADFQAVVVQIAARGGWVVYSVPDSRRATCSGFPDCVFMHPTGPTPLVVAELKRRGQRPRPDQEQWVSAFRCAGVPAFIWTPDSLPEIERTLAAPPNPTTREV
jgi:hypothetical protein